MLFYLCVVNYLSSWRSQCGKFRNHNFDAEDTHGTVGEVTMSKSVDGHYYIESMKRCYEKKTVPKPSLDSVLSRILASD